MKDIDERIENLSDEMLNVFVEGVARINCGSLLCNNCPLQIDGACLCVKLYDERDQRKHRVRTNEETVLPPTTHENDLETNAKELVKRLDHLLELLNKF